MSDKHNNDGSQPDTMDRGIARYFPAKPSTALGVFQGCCSPHLHGMTACKVRHTRGSRLRVHTCIWERAACSMHVRQGMTSASERPIPGLSKACRLTTIVACHANCIICSLINLYFFFFLISAYICRAVDSFTIFIRLSIHTRAC